MNDEGRESIQPPPSWFAVPQGADSTAVAIFPRHGKASLPLAIDREAESFPCRPLFHVSTRRPQPFRGKACIHGHRMPAAVRGHLSGAFDILGTQHINTHDSACFHIAEFADHLHFRLCTGGSRDRLLAFFRAIERLLS